MSASDVSARAVDSAVVEVGGHPAEEEGEDVVCGEVEPGVVEGALAVYGYGAGAGGGKVVERGEGRGNGGLICSRGRLLRFRSCLVGRWRRRRGEGRAIDGSRGGRRCILVSSYRDVQNLTAVRARDNVR